MLKGNLLSPVFDQYMGGKAMSFKVEKLKVNYKTLEEFKKFKEYGLQELSMVEDLEANIIENDSASPFYGIYFADKLVARMSLYEVEGQYNQYFSPPKEYLELWKLEVLPDYQGNGYGKALVEFAKSFGMPIKTNARSNSKEFWEKMNFNAAHYQTSRDFGGNPMIWFPEGFKELIHNKEEEEEADI